MYDRQAKLALMSALSFTERDLRSNQEGELSDSQVERLRRERSAYLGRSAIVLSISPVAGIYAVAEAGRLLHSAVPLLLLVALALGCYALYVWLRLRRLDGDLRSGYAAYVEGAARRSTSHDPTRGQHRYTLTVGDLRFEVSKRVYDAFEDDQRYRVYYTPNTQTLLSAERM
jgi:hypothetical protein